MLLLNGAVLGVGQRAGTAVADTIEVVLVTAELLRAGLDLERAETQVNGVPDDGVGLHGVD